MLFDNPKIIVLERDEHGDPKWNPAKSSTYEAAG